MIQVYICSKELTSDNYIGLRVFLPGSEPAGYNDKMFFTYLSGRYPEQLQANLLCTNKLNGLKGQEMPEVRSIGEIISLAKSNKFDIVYFFNSALGPAGAPIGWERLMPIWSEV